MDKDVREALALLERRGSRRNRDGMARYGIVADKAFGVSVADIRAVARQLGTDPKLADALWRSGWYEGKMLAVFVDDPAHVTPAQMDRWCRDFENWADCDAACFHLFDKVPHAYKKVGEWARRDEEFVKRAAFALAASLALHDKKAPDKPFMAMLPVIERAATDERNFVKKGVSWALRGIGMRNAALHKKAVALARKLAASDNRAARWVGQDAVRDLTRPLILKRVSAKVPGSKGAKASR